MKGGPQSLPWKRSQQIILTSYHVLNRTSYHVLNRTLLSQKKTHTLKAQIFKSLVQFPQKNSYQSKTHSFSKTCFASTACFHTFDEMAPVLSAASGSELPGKQKLFYCYFFSGTKPALYWLTRLIQNSHYRNQMPHRFGFHYPFCFTF